MNLYVPAMIEILLISVSVAMDAFAVSIGKGLTVTRVRPVDVIKTALWFGGFQALFPLLGFFAANTFSKYVTAVDHWIIFALLAFIGGNMIREAFGEEEENSRETAQFDWRHMLPLAVALGRCAGDVRFQSDRWPARALDPDKTVIIAARDLDDGERADALQRFPGDRDHGAIGEKG